MSPETIPYLLLPFVLGLAIGYALLLRGRRSLAAERDELRKEVQSKGETIAGLEAENGRIPALESELKRLNQDVVRPLESDRARLSEKADRIPELEKTINAREQTLVAAQRQITDLNGANKKLEAELSAERENFDKLKNAREELINQFEAISKRVLSTSNNSFITFAEQKLGQYQESAKGDLEKRQQAIDAIIKPVGETLIKFDQRVRDLELKRENAYSTLSEQVRSLAEGQTKLRTETTNLVQALRAPKTRGRWGEIQLRRVAEMAGMLNYCDFREQVSESSDEGDKIPDMIVRLPGGKNVIVDAKMVFDAFSDSINATDDSLRLAKLKLHAQQVRSRIKDLSGKSYWAQFQPTPEFVVLFLPAESLLYAALEQDPKLIEEGITDYVILATPTTLIAMLKAIYFGWRQEEIAENAREISDLGTELYKRLATVGEHFDDLGSHLNKAVEYYNKSLSSLERNVLTTARKLKDHRISGADKELREIEPIETTARVVDRLELRIGETIAVGPGLPFE